jgi:quercetin dioxygenase-like cupin family protein
MSPPSEPYALTPGEGQAIWYRGTLMTVETGAEQTGGALTLIENMLPAGHAAPPHVHHRDDEPWYGLEGELTFSCGELAFLATPGAFIFLTKAIPHPSKVENSTPAMLLLSYPAGLEKYFEELGEPAHERVLLLAG